MILSVLNSGNNGNCTYISDGKTKILIDCGISTLQTKKRLSELGIDVQEISAVLFTHEHTDHCKGLPVLLKLLPHLVPFANEGTASSMLNKLKNIPAVDWFIFENGQKFQIGTLTIESFAVRHNAGDPVGYVVSTKEHRVGYATDLGLITPTVESSLRDCDLLVLETNHDNTMLLQSNRPYKIIQHTMGRSGHLSNHEAATLLNRVISPRLKGVFAAHISNDCNTIELATAALRQAVKAANPSCTAIVYPTYRNKHTPLVSCS